MQEAALNRLLTQGISVPCPDISGSSFPQGTFLELGLPPARCPGAVPVAGQGLSPALPGPAPRPCPAHGGARSHGGSGEGAPLGGTRPGSHNGPNKPA